MKALKILAIVIGAVALLVALVVGLAFTSAVQTWAVRKAVAGQPGLAIEVGRVSAGMSAAQIDDLRVVQGGLTITVKQVSANYSAWDYLKHKRLNVDRVAVQGLLVDARTPAAPAAQPAAAKPPAASSVAAPSPAAPAFNGLLGLAQLPLDVRLAKLDVEGRALLPGARTVAFNLQGGGIELGQRGQLTWKIDFADAGKNAPLRALHTTGALALHLTADRRIDALEIENTAAAEGPNLPADRVKLEAKAEQPSAGANEIYTVRVSLVRQDKTEPVLNSRVEFLQASHELAGTWDVAVRSEQLAALLAGLGLPEVAVNGSGKFSFKPDTRAGAASGEIQGRLAQLTKLSPALAAVGPVELRAAFDAGLAGDVARLDRLEIGAVTEGRKLVQISTLQKVSFDLRTNRVALANPQAELARVALQSLPLAWAQPVVKPVAIDSGDLSLVLAIEAEPDGSHVRVKTIEPLTLRAVTVREGDRKLIDQMTLSLSPSLDYSATKITAEVPNLKLSLPAGDSVNGQLSATITDFAQTPVIAFSAQFQERLVSVLKPYLPLDPGPLAIESAVEGQLKGQTLQLAKFATTVKRDGGALLVAIETLQPLTADLAAVRLAAPQATAAAARVHLGEVPLAWAEAFVPKSKFTGALAGGTLDVALPAADEIALQTTEPVTIRGLGVTLNGQPQVQALDLAADFSATKRGDRVAGEVRRLEVKQGAASLLKFAATGDAQLGAKLRASGKGKLEADVAALLKQAALAPLATLSRGNVTTNFDVTLGDTLLAKATVAVRNLTAKPGTPALGDLDLTLDAALKPDGSGGTVKLPLTLVAGGRKSDLLLDGSFGRTAASLTFNGKLTSDQIIGDDFQALAALAPSTPAASNTPAAASKPAASRPATPTASRTAAQPAAPARDTAPFWKGVAGRFETDLKKVQYGRDYTISGIKGALVVTDTRLALDNLEGKFKDTPFKIAAGVTFSAQQPQPYVLTGTANVSSFDVGEFLRAVDPSDQPSLETKVSVNAKLQGNGATLPDLAQNAYGQFDVTGTAGVLRALSQKNFSGKAAGVASKLGGLLGAATGSDTTAALAELLSEMDEMKFDHFAMHVERGADLNLKLTTLEFISPDKHLTGSGQIEYRRGTPIQDQPLHVDMQLAAKEHTAVLLNRLGKLGNQQDAKGYYLMNRAFVITGTPAKPDPSDFQKFLREVAVEQGAKALFNLLGR